MTLSVSWNPPTKNADGSPLQGGEITGYEIGIGPSAGNYSTIVPVADPAAAVKAIEALKLPMGDYAAAIRTVGPADSAWSQPTFFKVTLVPMAPTDFRIALLLKVSQ